MAHIKIHGDSHGSGGDDPIPGFGPGGAPADATYLTATSNATLTNEVVVGTTPGGELGGTWAAPTVDSVHSGSAHHAEQHVITDTADHTFPGGTTTFLRADGTFATPAGGSPNASTTYQYQYDFAIDGGAAGVITLRNLTAPGVQIPAASIIRAITVRSLDNFSDDQAPSTTYIGVGIENTTDLQSYQYVSDFVSAIGSAAWFDGSTYDATLGNTNRFGNVLFDLSIAYLSIVTTAARDVQIEIAGGNLLSGKFNVWVEFVTQI